MWTHSPRSSVKTNAPTPTHPQKNILNPVELLLFAASFHADALKDVTNSFFFLRFSLRIVCKFVAIEMQGIMEDTGKTREVLDIGSRFDKKPKRIPYKFS